MTMKRKATFGLSLLAAGGALAFATSGCVYRYMAMKTAPEKTAAKSDTPLSKKAAETFWTHFYAGAYEKLPECLHLLTAAYLENPRDPEIALLLAHAHFWKVAERARETDRDPRITDHLVLAEKYFAEAQRLSPADARIPGWLGGVRLALGDVHKDERMTRHGYFTLMDGVDDYPLFNYFTAGYVFSVLSPENERFQEGLEYMWKTLDRAWGRPVDRKNPLLTSYLIPGMTEVPDDERRVLWNLPYAPHNFEGFFLAMGDMLVKNGQPDVAQVIYANARLSPDYASWPYKAVLERRIEEADARALLYRTEKDPERQPEMMIRSAYSCVGCHGK